jgi:hypothetical protein
MKKLLLTILLSLLIGSNSLFASSTNNKVDPFNTYRWNRTNHFAGNGQIDKGPWYEWWYYKVVLPESGKSYFFVYGVVNPWDVENTMKGTRAYVGMGNFMKNTQVEEHFDVDQFYASYDQTYIQIANQMATDKNIIGKVSDNGLEYQWNINIKKEWTFNATGWATGDMLTNIEWYPAQADAKCTGSIIDNGELIRFKNAPCYQDRNWGYSFPKWWTWIVSNHFKGHPDTTLAIGGGRPSFIGGIEPIEGVALGLNHKGKEFEFRPNDLDKVKIDITFGKWHVEANDFRYKVVVDAFAPKEKFMDLQFMTPEGVIFHDYETLTGKITVQIYERLFPYAPWTLVDVLYTDYGGIEYGSTQEYETI